MQRKPSTANVLASNYRPDPISDEDLLRSCELTLDAGGERPRRSAPMAMRLGCQLCSLGTWASRAWQILIATRFDTCSSPFGRRATSPVAYT